MPPSVGDRVPPVSGAADSYLSVFHAFGQNRRRRAEIAATVREVALLHQEAPVQRVVGYDVPSPLYALEDYYLPSVARVEEGIRDAVEF